MIVYWVKPGNQKAWPGAKHFYTWKFAKEYYDKLKRMGQTPTVLRSPKFEWEEVNVNDERSNLNP